MTPHPSQQQHHDVVVVGARCAGAATAMLLAAAGHDVLLLDRATFPSDTLSTHGIARGGVVQLQRWGLLQAVLDTGAPPIRSIAFHAGELHVNRQIKERYGVDMLVAPRRHALDTLLLNAAMSAGAHVGTGITVTGVHRGDDGRVTGVHADNGRKSIDISARFVIGADGVRSRIARSVGAPFTDVRPDSGAGHYAYFAGDWDAMEYYLSDRAFAGVFPTNNGEACVWVCSPKEDALRMRQSNPTSESAFIAMLQSASPELLERLETSATRTSTVRGAIGLPNHLRQPVGPGWALVGDAGYHRDPITGNGITDAFRDADLLATALDLALRGEVPEPLALRGYHAARDRQLRDIFEITNELVTFPAFPRFVELQRQLSAASDAQAGLLAARPISRLVAA